MADCPAGLFKNACGERQDKIVHPRQSYLYVVQDLCMALWIVKLGLSEDGIDFKT